MHGCDSGVRRRSHARSCGCRTAAVPSTACHPSVCQTSSRFSCSRDPFLRRLRRCDGCVPTASVRMYASRPAPDLGQVVCPRTCLMPIHVRNPTDLPPSRTPHDTRSDSGLSGPHGGHTAGTHVVHATSPATVTSCPRTGCCSAGGASLDGERPHAADLETLTSHTFRSHLDRNWSCLHSCTYPGDCSPTWRRRPARPAAKRVRVCWIVIVYTYRGVAHGNYMRSNI